MFNPALAKIAVNLVVSHCSGKVVSQVIRANITPVTRLQKVQCAVGTMALAGLAGNAAANAVVSEIETIEAFVTGVKEAPEQESE
jgi:hypothetical protein